MKHFLTFALSLVFIFIGCGGSSTHPPGPGSPIGPFVFMVGQTSDNLFTLKGSDSGAISAMTSTSTGHAPTAVLMEALSSFQMNLFVANSVDNNVTVFSLDPSTGVASPTGISAGVGAHPSAIGLRPPSGTAGPGTPVDHGSLYVLNQGSNSISGFQITDASGHLTALPGSPYATQGNPRALAVVTGGTSPTNIATFVYVANGIAGTISAFKMNPDNSLTEVAGSPFAAGTDITALTSRPGGVFVLASDAGTNKVLAFKIQQDTGALTALPGATVAAGTQPGTLSFAFGDFVYVANQGSNNVSGYKFDFSTATLAPVPGSPFAAGTNPVALGTTRPLQLYVANQGSSEISGFNIDSNTGALTPIAGSPFHTPAPPNSIQTLFVMNVD
ncbi:MAG TPA: beta-propeller fold lactonase family protein [Candidatus Angelobacter sp.]|nr:beta-propeller fold lactonase family protein [Candidatus Angelobacter sp.]